MCCSDRLSPRRADKGGSTEKFHEVTAAFETLGDADKRRDHDSGRGGGSGHNANFGSPQFHWNGFSFQWGGQQQHQGTRRDLYATSLLVQRLTAADFDKRVATSATAWVINFGVRF